MPKNNLKKIVAYLISDMATQNNQNTLPKFLESHKRQEDGPFTHTIIGNPDYNVYGGSYNIPDDKTDEFLELYYNYVFKSRNNAYLTEKHRENGPIVIDLDFRFDGNCERRYTEEFIVKFLDIYNNALYSIIEPPQSRCVAYIMEKENPVFQASKNITKDGLHIMYPHLVVEPNLQFAIRYATIMNPEIKNLFDSIGITNSVDDVFDKCVIDRNNWQMYGSMKPGSEPYKLTTRLDFNFNKITKRIPHRDCLRTLTVRNFNTNNIYTPSEEEKSKIEDLIKTIPEKHKAKKSMNLKRVKSPVNKTRASDEDYKMAKKLVNILSDHRANDYNDWIMLGFCLFNIDYRLLSTWDEFSKRSNKYQEGVCKSEWITMNNAGLGLGSLCRWAKEDNIMEYNRITSENKKKLLIDSLSGTHTDVARVIYHLYKNEFVCSAISKKVWFQFKQHRWRRTDDAVALKRYISDQVVNEYIMYQNENNNEAVQLDSSSSLKEILIERSNKINKLIVQLKKTSFKKSLIEECGELFYREKFEEDLDSNLDLVCFENGVYDLDKGEFREGYPEDYLSFTTGIYYHDYEDDSDEINDVKTFMSQVLPIKPVRDYMYRLLSSFVCGKVKEQKFHIWTGCGGNGKSKLIELFRMGFGDYCCTLPVSLLTQKRGRAEGATPALAQTKGKRFACLQEPDGDESINVGLMKELSGSDTITARALHQAPIEFKPQFKMVLTCNVLPEINASDRGTWRRVRAVEFKSVFTDNPDPNDAFQFQIDEQLDEKMETWKEPFMYLLLKEYAKYKEDGIAEPEDVMKFTKQYQNESDNFTQFFEECIEVVDEYSEGNGDFVSVTEMYQMYNDWFVVNRGTNASVPKKKDLKANAVKKFGTCNNNKFYGIKMKDIADNSEDGINEI